MISDHPIDDRRFIRRIAIGASGGALAILGLIMGSPLGQKAAMPGPLSKNHGHLRETCDVCHVDAGDAFQNPMHGIEVSHMDHEQSKLCLDCHNWGKHALQPHGWTPADREQRQAALGLEVGFEPFGVPLNQKNALSCSTCHREHRGRENELAMLRNKRCQACHQTRFEAFHLGHPEFSNYPQVRRTNLAFDHAEHILNHFRGDRKADAPSACTTCHVMNSSGRRMPVANYKAACASCHEDDIRGASKLEGSGMAVFVLPSLDTYTLEEAQVGVGQWPADSGVTEIAITPYQRLLLSTDSELKMDLMVFDSVDLLDLSEEDPATLEAVARVAWAIKSIFAEIEAGGHAALITRLEAATSQKIEVETAENLLAGLPEELVAQALRLWMPNLRAELADHQLGKPVPTVSELDTEEADFDSDKRHEGWVKSGGWFLQGLDYALRYRPLGHADPFYMSWLELSGRGGSASSALFEHLSRPEAGGTCIKCHSVERQGDNLLVHWNDGLLDEQSHSLTRFSHVSHFAMATDNACAFCHHLDRDVEDWNATYSGFDAKLFKPGFDPMQASECASCHNAQGAPSDCLTCHRYHPLQERLEAPGALLSALPIRTSAGTESSNDSPQSRR